MSNFDTSQKYGEKAALCEKWMRIWFRYEKQFADLPKWAQEILWKDINTAVEHRVIVMQTAAN
jgi:hypothetical protein